MKKSALVTLLIIINLPLLTSAVYAGSFEPTFENGPYAIAETKCDKSWLSGPNDIADLRPNMVAYESEIDHNGYMMSNSLIKKRASPPPLPTDISSPQVITEKHVQLHQSTESVLSIPDIDGVQLVHLSTPPKTYYISGSAAKKHINPTTTVIFENCVSSYVRDMRHGFALACPQPNIVSLSGRNSS